MHLGLGPLGVAQLPVEVGLHPLLALLAGIRLDAHQAPPTACSASDDFRIRRPRCRRDMTVPIGMSRICAASWYVKSPMSTSTTTSRKSCGHLRQRGDDVVLREPLDDRVLVGGGLARRVLELVVEVVVAFLERLHLGGALLPPAAVDVQVGEDPQEPRTRFVPGVYDCQLRNARA